MTELATARTGVIASTDTGLELERGMTFERWQQIGKQLAVVGNRLTWQIADWVFYGEWEYGSKYEAAIDELGMDYGTLRNYASVAGKFNMSRRRDNLSFAHHVEVASLGFTDQDHWLDLAEQHRWSRNELRARIRGERALPERTTTSIRLAFTIDSDRQTRYHAAAEQAGMTLDAWATSVLDKAAA